jgi:hypothetical protein
MQLDMNVQQDFGRSANEESLRSRLKTLALYALVIAGAALVLSQISRDFSLTLDQTRPFAQIVAVLLVVTALWGLLIAARSFVRRPRQVAWHLSFHLMGWLALLVSATGVVVLSLAEASASVPIAGTARAVEVVVPVVLAVQAALIFSPDDEPGLEVLLACSRPAPWLLLERVAVLFLAQGSVALAGIALCRLLDPTLDVRLMMARWLPPAVLLSGIGVYLTLRSRVAAFGATITGAIWFVFVFFGAALLPGTPTFWPLTLIQPFIWAFNPFLQPGDLPSGDYWLNRLIVTALGVGLLMLAAHWMGDEEQLLLDGHKRK